MENRINEIKDTLQNINETNLVLLWNSIVLQNQMGTEHLLRYFDNGSLLRAFESEILQNGLSGDYVDSFDIVRDIVGDEINGIPFEDHLNGYDKENNVRYFTVSYNNNDANINTYVKPNEAINFDKLAEFVIKEDMSLEFLQNKSSLSIQNYYEHNCIKHTINLNQKQDNFAEHEVTFMTHQSSSIEDDNITGTFVLTFPVRLEGIKGFNELIIISEYDGVATLDIEDSLNRNDIITLDNWAEFESSKPTNMMKIKREIYDLDLDPDSTLFKLWDCSYSEPINDISPITKSLISLYGQSVLEENFKKCMFHNINDDKYFDLDVVEELQLSEKVLETKQSLMKELGLNINPSPSYTP